MEMHTKPQNKCLCIDGREYNIIIIIVTRSRIKTTPLKRYQESRKFRRFYVRAGRHNNIFYIGTPQYIYL